MQKYSICMVLLAWNNKEIQTLKQEKLASSSSKSHENAPSYRTMNERKWYESKVLITAERNDKENFNTLNSKNYMNQYEVKSLMDLIEKVNK